ncbi:unnamed protein product [Caenorhabditis angaria]|uniref:Sdz-33 F-box domain-containing protein n=1 Tax=Caenorhabditis angaria TaxID=860376 RepID=A0A9P1ILZ7_9PELO|nr:unnamed protein product [Caenorhabditis angaria]
MLTKQTGWFDIPLEIREIIMNQMPLQSLLRFGGTCTKSQTESRNSNSYFDTIVFRDYYINDRVTRVPFKYFIKIGKEFCIVIEKLDENRSLVFGENGESNDRKILWSEIREENVGKVCLAIVKDFLDRIGKRLRRFEISTGNSRVRSLLVLNLNLAQHNYKNLQQLIIWNAQRQIDLIQCGFIDFETIKKITRLIEIPATNFKFDELLQVKASIIKIYLGEILTMENIRLFIDLWRNGKINPNFQSLEIQASYRRSMLTRKIEVDYRDLLHQDRISQHYKELVQSRIDPKVFLAIYCGDAGLDLRFSEIKQDDSRYNWAFRQDFHHDFDDDDDDDDDNDND